MVKLIALIQKVDHLSKGEFDAYWRDEHAAIFMKNPIAQRTVVSYTQTHLVQSYTHALVSKYGAERAAPRHDGIVECHFRSMDDLFELLDSHYHKTTVLPDEEKFIKKMELYIAEEEPKWANGKPGPGVKV